MLQFNIIIVSDKFNRIKVLECRAKYNTMNCFKGIFFLVSWEILRNTKYFENVNRETAFEVRNEYEKHESVTINIIFSFQFYNKEDENFSFQVHIHLRSAHEKTGNKINGGFSSFYILIKVNNIWIRLCIKLIRFNVF